MQLPDVDLENLMKQIATFLSGVLGLFLVWGKYSGRGAGSLKMELETVSKRIDKVDEQSGVLRSKLQALENQIAQRDIKRLHRINKIDTRVHILEREQERNITDMNRLSEEINRECSAPLASQEAIQRLTRDLSDTKKQLNFVSKSVVKHQAYLDEINRRANQKQIEIAS